MPSRFGPLFELSPLAIIIVDLDSGQTIDANARAAEMFGMPRESLIGADFQSFGYFESGLRARVAAELGAGRAVRGAEAWLRIPGRDPRWIQYSSQLIELDGKRTMFSMLLDISERRQAERRLDVQLAVASLLSTAGSLEEISGAILGQLCASGRWSSAKLRLLDPVTDAPRVIATWGREMASGLPVFTFPIVHAGATLGSIELATEYGGSVDPQLEAVCHSIGQQVGQFVVTSRAARDLQRSEARLSTVIESMTEGIVLGLPDGQLLHWNPAALELHGFTRSHDWERALATFTEIMELSTLDGTLVPFERWPMARILAGEKLRHLELRLRRTDIEWSRIFSYGGELLDLADGTQLVVLTMADITQRTQAVEELRRLNESLEQRVDERTASLSAANAELEAFTYSVSHDLRAPLRAIRGFAEILNQDYADVLPAPARRHLETIQARGERMSALLADLLELSKAVRKQMTRRPCDMAALAREALAELVPAGEPPCAVTIEELPPATADISLVRQVWVNLLSNALKFTRGTPGAQVTVGCVLAAPPAYFVRDTGAGFPAEDAGRLFVPFQRLHDQSEFEGTGVGLALVQRIVARHGGRVWAESDVGKGATFYFTLR